MFISAAAHQENMNVPEAVAEPGTETATVAVAPVIAEDTSRPAAIACPRLPTAVRFYTSTSSMKKTHM
jgi:hypothetical protein